MILEFSNSPGPIVIGSSSANILIEILAPAHWPPLLSKDTVLLSQSQCSEHLWNKQNYIWTRGEKTITSAQTNINSSKHGYVLKNANGKQALTMLCLGEKTLKVQWRPTFCWLILRLQHCLLWVQFKHNANLQHIRLMGWQCLISYEHWRTAGGRGPIWNIILTL